MRHKKKFNHLGRQKGHREALLRNLSIAVITHKRITTTLAKAKALRLFLEPLVTKSKNNTQHSRRIVFAYLQNKEAVTELYDVIAPKVGDRPGGYVRVIKTGMRQGDSAETAMIEFVDFNEVYTPGTKATGVKTARRGRRGGSKVAAAGAVAAGAAGVSSNEEEE
jgi:large subunit ribosomal protein L17